MNKELYAIMKDVYSKYTGEQVAQVIAQIRKEIEQELERRNIEERLQYLTDHLKDLK